MSVLTDKMRGEIVELLPRYPHKQAVTLPALHIVQDELRCVPRGAVNDIAEILELNPAQVEDTLSFYGFFRHEQRPLGRHRLWVCRSISCMLRGGEELLVELCSRLGLRPGETTADGRVTIEFAECLGMCEGAPCVLIGDECYPNQTPESALQLVGWASPTDSERSELAGGAHPTAAGGADGHV